MITQGKSPLLLSMHITITITEGILLIIFAI